MGDFLKSMGNNVFLIYIGISVVLFVTFLIIYRVSLYLTKQKRINASEVYLKNGEFDKVLASLKDVVKSGSGTYLQMHYVAQAFEGMQNYTRAIDFYEKCMVRLPLNESEFKDVLFLKIARLFHRIGRLKEALGYFETVVNKKTTSKHVYYEIALVLFQMQKYTSVQNHLETYLRYAPKDVNALLLLGKTYFYSNSYQKAVNTLLSIVPEVAKTGEEKALDCKLHLAKSYIMLKKYPGAKEIYENILTENGDIVPFLPEYIIVLSNVNEPEKAEKILNDNMDKLTDEARQESLYLMGTNFWERRQYRKAMDYWKRIFAENPEFKDLGDIMRKYSPFMENQVFDFLYDDVVDTENKIKSALNISHAAESFVQENFWVFFGQNECYILNRRLSPFTLEDIEACESFIKSSRQTNNNYILLSYYHITPQCQDTVFYKKLRILQGTEFIGFFSEKIWNLVSRETN
ncbi:MAG: hypothetical protein A2Y33_15695 [Spirochaetes bacterium GWF1_51_8]|nr:MAG: hypothetical protein A2Y33_15695 [Spirochaetes bacterium GWF1_51_8]